MMTVTTAQEYALDKIEQMFSETPELATAIQTEHLFCSYILNILEGLGLAWRGQSIKNNGWSVLLVLKVARDGIPLVGFITERTTTDCMRVALTRLREDRMTWTKDKFAQI